MLWLVLPTDSADGAPYALESCPLKLVLIKDTSRVDDHGLAGHGLGATHRNHDVGAVVVVGRSGEEHGSRRSKSRLLPLAERLDLRRDDDALPLRAGAVGEPARSRQPRACLLLDRTDQGCHALAESSVTESVGIDREQQLAGRGRRSVAIEK